MGYRAGRGKSMLALDDVDMLRIVDRRKMEKAHRLSAPMDGGVDGSNARVCCACRGDGACGHDLRDDLRDSGTREREKAELADGYR